MTGKHIILKKLLRIVLLLILISFKLEAQEIKKINVTKTNSKLYISAQVRVDKAVLDEVFDLLYNGVKITIVYTINIYKERPFYYFKDYRLKTIKYKKMIKYNMWEKKYYLTDGSQKVKTSSRKDISKNLKHIKDVYLVNRKDLKDGKYYLKIKASLESVKLAPPLSWIFSLVTDLGFETSWAKKELNE